MRKVAGNYEPLKDWRHGLNMHFQLFAGNQSFLFSKDDIFLSSLIK